MLEGKHQIKHSDVIMQLLVYYCCLDVSQNQQAFIDASLKELEHILGKSPLSLNYSFRQLPTDLKNKIDFDADDLFKISDNVVRILNQELKGIRALLKLLVCTEYESGLAKLCRNYDKSAWWGVSTDWMAVVYKLDNKYAIWHETLHLLGAHDCYRKGKDGQVIDRGPTCNANCVMVYAPSEETVNIKKWPFLCEKNLCKLRKKFDHTAKNK